MKVATLLCPAILCKKSPRNPDLKEVGHSLSLDEKQSPLEYGSVCIPPAVSVDKAAQASGSWELEANVNQKHSIQTCHHISVSHYYWTFKDKSNFKMKKEDFETLQSIARLNWQIFPRGKKWKAPQQSAFRSFQKPQPTVWDWIWMGCEKDPKTTRWNKSRVAWAYVSPASLGQKQNQKSPASSCHFPLALEIGETSCRSQAHPFMTLVWCGFFPLRLWWRVA